MTVVLAAVILAVIIHLSARWRRRRTTRHLRQVSDDT